MACECSRGHAVMGIERVARARQREQRSASGFWGTVVVVLRFWSGRRGLLLLAVCEACGWRA